MTVPRFTLLLWLVLALTVSGCGGDDEAPAETASPTAPAASTATPPANAPSTDASDEGTTPGTSETGATETGAGQNGGNPGSSPPAAAGITRIEAPAPLPPPPALDVVVAPEPVGLDEFVARVTSLEPALLTLRDEIDRSLYDPVALNFALNFEPDALVAFVSEEIAFEQYPGALRGASGTLRGRAGNSLDQALLLTRLLEDAGYEWRIQRGTLDEAGARRLLAHMARPRPAAPPPGEINALEAAVSALFSQKAGSATAGDDFLEALGAATAADDWEAIVAGDAAFIEDALNAARISLGDGQALTALIAEARDYFWVEYRLDAFDAWRPAHPAFDTPPEVDAAESYREIPAELYHRVQIAVFIEQKVGEELFVSPIVNTPEWPAAALAGRPLTFRNQPNNLDFDTPVETLLQETGILLPQINGQNAGNGFDLDGRVYDLFLLSQDKIGARELFQAVAGNVEGALGALGGLSEDGAPVEDPDDVFTLTAQWIEYTLIAPDGSRETHRRYLLDRIGPAQRAAGDATIPASDRGLAVEGLSLLNDLTIVVQTGRYNVAYFVERWTARQQAEIELIRALDPAAPGFGLPPDLAERLVPLEDLLNDVAGAYPAENGRLLYTAEPNITIFERGLVPGSERQLFERVDVVNNTRRAIATADGEVAPAPELALRAGIWDTHAERALVALGAHSPTTSALARLRAATAAGDFVVVTPPVALTETGLALGPRTMESMARDLEDGFVLIVPIAAGPDPDDRAWWRVNPATGETLGVVTGGYGTVQTEYLISFAATVGFSAAGTAACQAAGGSFACCLANNAAVGAVGLGVGAGAGWLLGKMMAQTLYQGALLSATNALLFDLGLNVGLGYVPPFGCGT